MGKWSDYDDMALGVIADGDTFLVRDIDDIALAATGTQKELPFSVARAEVNKPTLTGTFAAPITSSGAYTLAAAACYGGVLFYNDADIIALPAAVKGMSIVIYNTGANVITIDPDGTDVIVRDGTSQTAGYKITLTAGAGNFVTLVADAANHWVTLGYKGTLADGGA
jgi:hypothetical protein